VFYTYVSQHIGKIHNRLSPASIKPSVLGLKYQELLEELVILTFLSARETANFWKSLSIGADEGIVTLDFLERSFTIGNPRKYSTEFVQGSSG